MSRRPHKGREEASDGKRSREGRQWAEGRKLRREDQLHPKPPLSREKLKEVQDSEFKPNFPVLGSFEEFKSMIASMHYGQSRLGWDKEEPRAHGMWRPFPRVLLSQAGRC